MTPKKPPYTKKQARFLWRAYDFFLPYLFPRNLSTRAKAISLMNPSMEIRYEMLRANRLLREKRNGKHGFAFTPRAHVLFYRMNGAKQSWGKMSPAQRGRIAYLFTRATWHSRVFDPRKKRRITKSTVIQELSRHRRMGEDLLVNITYQLKAELRHLRATDKTTLIEKRKRLQNLINIYRAIISGVKRNIFPWKPPTAFRWKDDIL